MSATAFLLAREGDQWSLHATGIPIEVRREFKRIKVEPLQGVDEMRYFDTYGKNLRKRFKQIPGEWIAVDEAGDEPEEFQYTGDEPVEKPRKRRK